mgnify:CR=1 FL=1
MSESLKELEQIKADLLANEKKIIQAKADEAEKQAEAQKKVDSELKIANQIAFVKRQELINLEKTLAPLVSQYAQLKRNHIKNDITDKWDAFIADLKGEKKPRKKRATKIEE